MSEELKRKMNIRGGHRANLTKLLKETSEILNNAANGDEEVDVIPTIKRKKVLIEAKLKVLGQLDEEVLSLLSSTEAIENDILQADNVQESGQEMLIWIDDVLSSKSLNKSKNDVELNGPKMVSGPSIHLPKLNLKKFNGEITKWPEFWDCFSSAIHENNNLSTVEKFNYLYSLLEGAAENAISGLRITAANYTQAVEILNDRFGNKQCIINNHMDALLNLPAVTNANDLKHLRQLYDNIEIHVRGLTTLDIASDSYGNLLMSIIMGKIPQELRLILTRNLEVDNWDIDVMLKLFQAELQARERANNVTMKPQAMSFNNNAHFSRPTNFRPSINKNVPTAATFIVNEGESTSNCTYCRSPSHISKNCNVFTTATSRKDILRKQGRCFVCLRKNHMSKDCKSRIKCFNCARRHHVSICSEESTEFPPKQVEPMRSSYSQPKPHEANHSTYTGSTQQFAASNLRQHSPLFTPHGMASNPQQGASSLTTYTGSSNSQQTSSTPQAACFTSRSPSVNMFVDAKTSVLLQTAKIKICSPDNVGRHLTARVILDTGSQRTYVTSRLKNDLQLPSIGTEQIIIKTFGSNADNLRACELVELCLYNNESNLKLTALTVPDICSQLNHQAIKIAQQNYPHLSGLPLADSVDEDDGVIDVLIGSDHYWKIVTGEVIRGNEDEPTALRTIFGWILSGPVKTFQNSSSSINLLSVSTNDVSKELRRFWEVESLGVSHPTECVQEKFEESVTFTDGKYTVRLPWKEFHPPLPNNYNLCVNRLQSLIERLRKNPEVLKEYDDVIKDQLSKGVIERVQSPEQNSDEIKNCHYLPHHPVIKKERETTKVRVVYDASAKSKQGPSLNDCLHPGPNLTKNIVDILLRFRIYKVALIGDIEKAFLMVAVDERDRDALRFLWFDDIYDKEPNLIVYRFTRVVFGVTSSPFLLNATLLHHVERYRDEDPRFVETVLQSLYVDDVTYGGKDEEEVYKLYQNSKQRLLEGGFNLRKFTSNSSSLMKKIKENEGQSINNDVPTDLHKVLGVQWDVSHDVLVFNFERIVASAKALQPTKRNIISVASRFYDPLGFISPITVQMKLLFQDLCKLQLDWDDEVEGPIKDSWTSIIDDLETTKEIKIQRFLLEDIDESQVTSYSLQGFCDASEKAYAAVVYLKIETNGEVQLRFLSSKTRVCPIKKMTIPKLELMSALILTRLIDSITKALSSVLTLSSPTCWTDSKVVYYWIIGVNKIRNQFVERCLSEVRKVIPPEAWNHCMSAENPADIPSRGIKSSKLTTCELWTSGPKPLVCGKDREVTSISEEDVIDLAAIDPHPEMNETHVMTCVSNNDCYINDVIPCESFSNLGRLLKVTAYVLLFIRKLKAAISKDTTQDLTFSNDYQKARQMWLKDVQKTLVKNPKFLTWKREFDIFEDDQGLLRCGGRLEHAQLPDDTKKPIILESTHHLTTLIVRDCHKRVKHNGTKETLTELRANYWIVKGRQFVRKLVHSCTICKKYEGKPYDAPVSPSLPEYRVKEDLPFANVGIDFAGPLNVKSVTSNDIYKVWISLYTCCVTRGVHLDLVTSLTTEAFLQNFRRFTARRGIPKMVISDNAKTFKSASKRLSRLLDIPEVQNHLLQHNVKWSFILEKAPWWGGFYERMIKSMKRCMKKTLGNACVTYEELSTVLTEVEAVLNSRPLSYVSCDDIEEPLTPSHLIYGRRILSLPSEASMKKNESYSSTQQDLIKRAKHTQQIKDHFWKRWSKEYLLELRNTHRQSSRKSNKETTNISEGDIVIIHDDNRARSLWKLGKVQSTITGRDGQIRGAFVKTQGNVLRRPVQKLFPLELNVTDELKLTK